MVVCEQILFPFGFSLVPVGSFRGNILEMATNSHAKQTWGSILTECKLTAASQRN